LSPASRTDRCPSLLLRRPPPLPSLTHRPPAPLSLRRPMLSRTQPPGAGRSRAPPAATTRTRVGSCRAGQRPPPSAAALALLLRRCPSSGRAGPRLYPGLDLLAGHRLRPPLRAPSPLPPSLPPSASLLRPPLRPPAPAPLNGVAELGMGSPARRHGTSPMGQSGHRAGPACRPSTIKWP
ncbi:unnamed protein product, partial [Urochloa humidicola]